MAIKTLRVFQEFTSAGYIPMPVAGNIDYGVTIAGTFPGTTPTTFQTDDPDIDVTLTATTDYYVWIRSHGTDWNPMYTRNVRVYPDSPLINNVVMGIIIANLSSTVPYTGATQNVNLGEYGLTAGYLGLDLTPTATPTTVGTMSWNDADGTMDLKLKGGNVTLQVGQEQVTRIVNKTGVNLLEANYQAVRISGAQGNRLKVDLAQANIDANSTETLGLVTETINNNQEGFITTSGLVRAIDTTGTLQGEIWNDGDILYLSGSVAGQITNIKPQAPTHTVIMGYVVRAHQTQGQIYVKVDNGYELDELHNVKITSVANKNTLVYDTATLVWKNRNIFGTQGYIPYYDDTLLMKDSIIYTNGTNVGIGSTTLTEKLVVNGNILATQFKKVGGLSTEFLKADGSSDATAYQPLSADLTAIDNLALTTGLLRKNGTDTWELDQTEYLSVPNAISTYQRIDNLQSNLTASATKYPSVNAVNSGLALKLNLTGGTLSGALTLNYSYPNIALSDVSSGTTWNITNDGGAFKLNYGATNKFYIFSNGNAEFINNLTASSLIKAGGTSTQFLKADGSVDSTTYQPYDADLSAIAALALTTGLLRKNGANTWELDQTEYVPLSTLIANYQTIANLSSTLVASATKYPSVNAVNSGLNLRLALTGGTLTGDLALSYSIPTIQLSDTSSGTIWNIQNDGGGFEINSGITNKFVMLSSGNATFVNDLTANKFIKSGGTSSQFLMADGSVSSGNAGTVTSVGLSAPTGFSVSGSPVTSSGTLSLSFALGYSLPTTASQGTWDTAYNRSLVSIGVSGTTTKTLTLTKQDGTTLSASWSDINTDAVTSVFGRTGAIIATSGDYTTAQVTESGNLYYLDSRARASISGGTGISYNSTTGVITNTITQYTDALARASISGGTGISYNSTSGVITNTITQYTDALARASLSFVAGSGAYNSTTGVITIPTNTSQLTNGAGYITGITSLMVTNALGYTPVTNARQLTINGTTYDLSADRSWTISGTIGGLTSGYIPKATSASTLGNSIISESSSKIDINGTLSVGMTVSPFYNAKFKDYSDGSGVYIGSVQAGGYKYISGESYYNNSTLWYSDLTTSTVIGLNDGIIKFYTNSGLTANTNFTPSERMRINANGNVSIGNTNNSYKLDVSGTFNVSGATFFNGVNSLIGSSYFKSSSTLGFIVNDSTDTYNNFISYNNGNAYVRSNLGIGTTSPAYKLDVNGSFNFTTGGNYLTYNSGILYHGNYYQYPSGNNYLLFARTSGELLFGSNDTERMRITSAGNLLVGTTTDSGYRLNVNGSQGFFNNGLRLGTAYSAIDVATGAGGLYLSGSQGALNHVFISPTGNTGIGTTNPQEKLQVSGANIGIAIDGTTSSRTYYNRSGSYIWSTGLRAGDTNYYIYDERVGARLIINDAGNLGLGVTPSAWSAGLKALQIGSQTALVNNSQYTYLSTNWDGNGDKYLVTGYSTIYRQQSGEHAWFTAPSGTAGTAISFTQAMTLDASGNLLVGTTSSSLPYGGGGKFAVYQSGASALWLGGNTLSFDGQGTARDLNFYFRYSASATLSTDSYFKFVINSVEYMRLSSSANLLIGTTTDSGYKLDVNGTGRFSSSVDVGLDINLNRAVSPAIVSTTNQNIRLVTNGFTAQLRTDGIFSTSEGFRTDGKIQAVNLAIGASYYNTSAPSSGAIIQGNVGIGTTSPTDFTIYGYGANIEASGGRGGGFVSSNSSSTYKMVMSVDSSGGVGMLKTLTNHPLMFATNDVEKMRITSGGSVGIGTSSPSALMQIYTNRYNDSLTFNATAGFIIGGSIRQLSINTDDASPYNISFQAKTNGNAAANIVFQTQGGNVGIGETSPSEGKLVINNPSGSTNSGVSGNTLYLKAQTANANLIRFSGAIATDLIVGRFGNADAISIGTTGGTEIARFLSSGNVLIGTTTDSGYKLDVVGGNIRSYLGGMSDNESLFEGNGSYLKVKGRAQYAALIIDGTGTNVWELGIRGETTFRLKENGNARLSIASGGAATFSSSVTATQFKTPGFVEPTSVKGLFNNTNYSGPGWNNASLVTGNGATGVMMGGDAGLYAYGWIQGVQTDTGGVKGLYLNPLGGGVTVGGATTFNSTVTATAFYESSSIAYKNILATNPTTALNVDVIKYTRKNIDSDDVRYGYSAEQINSLMPELTNKDVTAVKYLDVHTLLIAELQREIKELKSKLK